MNQKFLLQQDVHGLGKKGEYVNPKAGYVLLLEDVYGLGKKGDIVKPKAGYARNFLLPQHKKTKVTLAVVATVNMLRKQDILTKSKFKNHITVFCRSGRISIVRIIRCNKLFGKSILWRILKKSFHLTSKAFTLHKIAST